MYLAIFHKKIDQFFSNGMKFGKVMLRVEITRNNALSRFDIDWVQDCGLFGPFRSAN